MRREEWRNSYLHAEDGLDELDHWHVLDEVVTPRHAVHGWDTDVSETKRLVQVGDVQVPASKSLSDPGTVLGEASEDNTVGSVGVKSGECVGLG